MDDETLEKFIYEELGRRLGGKTAHVRKSPFAEPQVRKTNATKKVIRKVVQKYQLSELFVFAQSVKRLVIQRLIVLESSRLKSLIMYTKMKKNLKISKKNT